MKLLQEFKEFALRGYEVDMEFGILIGANFNKIVSSLVTDIITPPLGILMGGVNFADIKLTLKGAVLNAQEKVIQEAVTMNIGNFLQVLLDFIIVAFTLFVVITGMNMMRNKAPFWNADQKTSK